MKGAERKARDLKMMERRVFLGWTCKRIAEENGISRTRVSQILRREFRIYRGHVHRRAERQASREAEKQCEKAVAAIAHAESEASRLVAAMINLGDACRNQSSDEPTGMGGSNR